MLNPIKLSFNSPKTKISQISCGMDHILLLESIVLLLLQGCGKVFSYGKGSRGELGLGEGVNSCVQPVEVQLNSDNPAIRVYAGVRTSFILLGISPLTKIAKKCLFSAATGITN